MHQPGYIQEGQETIFGYLLLGVYYRNSPGCTVLVNCSMAHGRGSSERMMEQMTAATEVEKTSAL